MRASESDIIHVVSVGYGRPNGVKFLPPLFEGTPYRMVSFLDLVSSREPFRYSAHNMGVVLETLHPRPKAFVVGIAIDPSYCDEMEKVWNSYVENVLKPESENGEWEKNAFVPLPRTHFVDPKQVTRPPANFGWEAEMFRQLDSVFRPEEVDKGNHKVVPEN
ncbi:hypothetical protein BDV30DRAFT_207861 [Aspergillus minisclerotigenes]|uniref:Uncharacterized protein n=1 Tax=Aspergillus minisclerotigenes TaxID=656917 RepID=A0A5N6JBK0_9EURO|nr:hypothetical protein BDV30DRAFT_207861 [Aspergillus minisclerotigenes]